METAKTKATKGKEYAFEQYDLDGGKKGDVVFSNKMLSINSPAVQTARYIRAYMTNSRQGTAKAKGRSEVAGTTKKVYKQKGTGKARHGSQRAPIFKGGGVVGGPLPKDYSLSINKKQKKQVLMSAVAQRMKDGAIVGVSVDPKATAKTKTVATFLKKMNMTGQNILFVVPAERMEGLVLSIRNLKNTAYVTATNINAYKVLSAGKIIFINDAFADFEKHFTA